MRARGLLMGIILAVLLLPARAWCQGTTSTNASPGTFQFHYRNISLKKYMFIEKGMSEAQVLALLGPPSWVDRWSCDSGEGCHLKKVYYYMGNPANREMTTVIYFTDGKVTKKERYRSWLSQ